MDEKSDVEAHRHIVEEIKERFGLNLSVDELLEKYTKCAERAYNEFVRNPIPGREYYEITFEYLLSDVGVNFTKDDIIWCGECWKRNHAKYVRLYPDVRETLIRLKNLGMHIGLITDANRSYIEMQLEALKIRYLFDSITTVSDAGAEKPDKKIFLHALESAGVSPNEAVMVGDLLTKDIVGAKSVGMTAVLLLREPSRVYEVLRRAPIEPDFIVHDLYQLVDVVTTILMR